ncbi:MAG: hypothetical protein IJF17_06360 [Thermoguttaceae bacterium]|nr:hypothetical protein [Thermoguttaceae bacterium]
MSFRAFVLEIRAFYPAFLWLSRVDACGEFQANFYGNRLFFDFTDVK